MDIIRIALVTIHAGEGAEAIPLGAACVASALKADAELKDRVTVFLVEAFPSETAASLALRIQALKPDAVGFSLYLWNRAASVATASILGRSPATPDAMPDATPDAGSGVVAGGRVAGATSGSGVVSAASDGSGSAAGSGKPRLFLFAGGPDASARPEGLATDAGGPFDFVVRGEGEAAVVALFRTFAADARATVAELQACSDGAAVLDLTALASPWLDGTLDPSKRDGVLWELARGCTFACSYCFESKGERRVRYFPQERIEAELAAFEKAALEENGVKSVFVLDPTFNADKERARRILDRIASKKSGIHFHFEVRAETLDRGLAKRFAAIGASIQIGLQSSDPVVCSLVGRKLEKGLFASRIGLLNDEGAVFGLDLIYGLPGDRLEGWFQSLDFALGLYPNNLDLFRLAVLPGTELWDRAGELGLDHDKDAPYLVRSTPLLPAAALDKAERLAHATDLFYNKGRAVAWFNQVLSPLGVRPSVFLDDFSRFMDRVPQLVMAGYLDPTNPVGLESLQLAYLDARFEEAEMDYLLPAIWDTVRFHGAWGRALVEGIATDIEFYYDPDEVLGPDALDLETFVSLADRHSGRYRMEPTEAQPELVRR